MSDPDRSERPREWWRSRMGDPQQHTDWGKEWHARRWHKRRRWFFGRPVLRRLSGAAGGRRYGDPGDAAHPRLRR
ncbi:MAG: hypothetical protein R2873_20310 [Caldilineaceae bacterium]